MNRPMIRRKPSAQDMSWHPLIGAIDRFLPHDSSDPWTGTSAQLLAALNDLVSPATKQGAAIWPQNDRALTIRLEKLAPALHARGISFSRLKSNGVRNIALTRLLSDRAA